MDLWEINVKGWQHSQKGNSCLWGYNLEYLWRLIFFHLCLMPTSNFLVCKHFRFYYKKSIAKTSLKNKVLYQKALQKFGCFGGFFPLLFHCAGSFCSTFCPLVELERLILLTNLKKNSSSIILQSRG